MHIQYLRNAPGEGRKDAYHILDSHCTDWYYTKSAGGKLGIILYIDLKYKRRHW